MSTVILRPSWLKLLGTRIVLVALLHAWKEYGVERPYKATWDFEQVNVRYARIAGDTAKLRYGEYHRITFVPGGGVWTLFITGKYRGTWGFLVDGVKIQWRKYLGLEPK